MSFIGIDLGGTFIKGAILNIDELHIHHVRRVPFPGFEAGDIYERIVSADKVMNEFYKLLDELLALSSPCEGVLLCGQMHALVFCDATGAPKSDIITWQDQRALSPIGDNEKTCFDNLKDLLGNWDLQSLGNEFRPGLPLTQLFYLQQTKNLPERLYPVSLMDFVAANLCGTLPSTDPTNAEAHGLFKLRENDWDFPLIKKLGFDKLQWQEVKPHFSIAGTFTKDNHEIPCYVSFGDQQCALLGSFLEKSELSLNIATGSQVSLLSNSCEIGEYQTRPYFENRYIKTITHIPGGRALNALVRLLTEISAGNMNLDAVWGYIQRQVEQVQGTELAVSTTFNNGPLGSRGYISNMDENNMTVGGVFYAAFENMAMNYQQCAHRISAEKHWDRIVFSGGLIAKHPALQKAILGKMGNIPFRINSNKEDVLIGLLIIATKIKAGNLTLDEASSAVQASNTIQEL